jgi:hypothetical protein
MSKDIGMIVGDKFTKNDDETIWVLGYTGGNGVWTLTCMSDSSKVLTQHFTGLERIVAKHFTKEPR